METFEGGQPAAAADAPSRSPLLSRLTTASPPRGARRGDSVSFLSPPFGTATGTPKGDVDGDGSPVWQRMLGLAAATACPPCVISVGCVGCDFRVREALRELSDAGVAQG